MTGRGSRTGDNVTVEDGEAGARARLGSAAVGLEWLVACLAVNLTRLTWEQWIAEGKPEHA